MLNKRQLSFSIDLPHPDHPLRREKRRFKYKYFLKEQYKINELCGDKLCQVI